MKKNTKLFFLIIFSISFLTLNAQQKGGGMGGSVLGKVIDKTNNAPVEYANVILFSLPDSLQVTGTISDDLGVFKLEKIKPGKYYLKVSFIGYQPIFVESFQINRNNRILDLSEIELPRKSYQLEEAQITAEKPPIEYKIDKKVVNVAEYYSATTGTAVEVLENVPSITVDIEGNVQLRGSSSFTVLIDGRPSVLDANDALEQIPASMIENIEIITNPSAKFDSEGEAGIINILMKDEEASGVNGVVNTNAGFDENYGGDFLLNYRNSKFSFNIGADYNHRSFPGTTLEEKQTFYNDTTLYNNSSGSNRRGGKRWSINGGADYSFTPNDLLSLSFRYGGRSRESSSLVHFDEFSKPGDLSTYYLSKNVGKREGVFYGISLDYNHKFNSMGHLIKAQVYYRKRDMDEESINELLDGEQNISSGRKLTEDGPAERIQFKLDYELPFSETNKFEAGGEVRFGESSDGNELYDYLLDQNDFILQPEFGYNVDYIRNIHALYGIYSGQTGSFGYQAGLRGEYTDREISLGSSNNNFTINRWDYFPTFHFSYEISTIQQLMMSYTRRIRRARGWQLEPFEIWTDAFNIRRGNPGLEPQYIDSYELGFQTIWGTNIISLEGYYRQTDNYIERIRSVYDKNVTLTTFENVGKTSSIGGEFMFNAKPVKFWNFNLLGNLYNYKIDGEMAGRSFDRESFNWNARFNNTFILNSTTRFQFNTSYNSPTVLSQGEREGYFMASMSVRKDFFDKLLTATLQVRDVFSSMTRESTIEALDFSSYSEFNRKAPMVSLNLKFNINNYKNDKKKRDNDDGDEDF